MVSAMKYALTLAIIASFACSAYGLQCYVCDSVRDPKCGEKFESQEQFKQDCARLSQHSIQQFVHRNATGCMKRFYDQQPGHPRIERNCFFGDTENKDIGCASITQITQKLLNCEVCKNNLCNGSSAMAPIGLAIVTFFVLARIFS